MRVFPGFEEFVARLRGPKVGLDETSPDSIKVSSGREDTLLKVGKTHGGKLRGKNEKKMRIAA